MRALLAVLVGLVVVGIGLIGYLLLRGRESGDRLPEIGAESVAVYRTRAESLATEADSLERALLGSGLTEQPGLRRHLGRLREEIAELRRAVGEWEAARQQERRNAAYRECILIYGRASGVCDALKSETPRDTARHR